VNFSTQLLIASGVSPTVAKTAADPLKAAMALYDINTPERIAAFLGQCFVESAMLTKLEEDLFYKTPERLCAVWPGKFKTVAAAAPYARNPQKLANFVYANRNGNGPEATGNGWAYRGSGYIQLTGLDNFVAASKGTGRPYVISPELVRQPSDAALTAAWYWHTNGCNQLADAGNIDGITRAVNGKAMLHAYERRKFSSDILTELA
jgi:putative chitinase